MAAIAPDMAAAAPKRTPVSVEAHDRNAQDRHGDSGPAAPLHGFAQEDDRKHSRERHVQLNDDGHDGGRRQRDADEHQAEMDSAVEQGDDGDVAHAAGRDLQERNQEREYERETQTHKQQRRHLADAHFGGDEVEAPDRADQEQEQEMLRRHCAGCSGFE
jgi:hypothetical protein